ncbi:MAG: hypothetical protein ACE5GU_06340 [Candidatus Scalinduaceae bacterium]
MNRQLVPLFFMAIFLLIISGLYPTASGNERDDCARIIYKNDTYSNNSVNVSICTGNRNLSKPSYKPVPDTYLYIGDKEKSNDNFLYKEWCEKTFDNGSYIYEAYKNIAFNIEYTPEPYKTDFWQTSLETVRLKKGDCEDAVFHFFSQLPPDQRNAEIIWGWVIDRQDAIGTAHVWYQLMDKEGKQYIVEGFSKDWNGIIPMEIVEKTETRRSTFTIVHSSVSRLANLPLETDDEQIWEFFPHFIDTQHYHSGHILSEYPLNAQEMLWEYRKHPTMSSNVGKEICNILKKLHELFSRYESQKEDSESDILVPIISKTKR